MPNDGNAVDPVETRLQRALSHVADSADVPAPPIADLVRADRRRRRRTTAAIGVAVILIGLLALTLRGTAPESSLDVVTTPTPGPSAVEAPNLPAPFPSGTAVDPQTRYTLAPGNLPPIESGVSVGFVFPMLVYGNTTPKSGPTRLFVDDGTSDREVCPNWSAGADGDCGRNINGLVTRMLWTAPEVTDPDGHTYVLHLAMQPTDGALAIVSNRVEVHVKPRGTITNGTGVQLGAGGGLDGSTFSIADQAYGAMAGHDWATLDRQLKGPPALLHNESGWANSYEWVHGQFLIVTRTDPPVPPATNGTTFHAWLVLNGSVPGDPSAPDGQHVTECVTLRVASGAYGYSVEVVDASQREASPGRVAMTEATDLQNRAC